MVLINISFIIVINLIYNKIIKTIKFTSHTPSTADFDKGANNDDSHSCTNSMRHWCLQKIFSDLAIHSLV